jgi:hypothetical protein
VGHQTQQHDRMSWDKMSGSPAKGRADCFNEGGLYHSLCREKNSGPDVRPKPHRGSFIVRGQSCTGLARALSPCMPSFRVQMCYTLSCRFCHPGSLSAQVEGGGPRTQTSNQDTNKPTKTQINKSLMNVSVSASVSVHAGGGRGLTRSVALSNRSGHVATQWVNEADQSNQRQILLQCVRWHLSRMQCYKCVLLAYCTSRKRMWAPGCTRRNAEKKQQTTLNRQCYVQRERTGQWSRIPAPVAQSDFGATVLVCASQFCTRNPLPTCLNPRPTCKSGTGSGLR